MAAKGVPTPIIKPIHEIYETILHHVLGRSKIEPSGARENNNRPTTILNQDQSLAFNRTSKINQTNPTVLTQTSSNLRVKPLKPTILDLASLPKV